MYSTDKLGRYVLSMHTCTCTCGLMAVPCLVNIRSRQLSDLKSSWSNWHIQRMLVLITVAMKCMSTTISCTTIATKHRCTCTLYVPFILFVFILLHPVPSGFVSLLFNFNLSYSSSRFKPMSTYRILKMILWLDFYSHLVYTRFCRFGQQIYCKCTSIYFFEHHSLYWSVNNKSNTCSCAKKKSLKPSL